MVIVETGGLIKEMDFPEKIVCKRSDAMSAILKNSSGLLESSGYLSGVCRIGIKR